MLRGFVAVSMVWMLGSLGLLPSPARADAPARDQIVVRLRAEGPHAVTACAQALHEAGSPFADATADGSDSLDRLNERVGVRRVRALFRRPDGRRFADQREALARRWEEARARRETRVPRARSAAPDLSHVYLIDLPAGSDADAAAALYGDDPHVAWAQPNLTAELDAAPDDPFYASSGSWGNPYPDLWGLFRIDAESAWDTTRGEGIVVAVVDSGIDLEHPDIADNLWVNPGEDLDGNGRADATDRNGIDDDGNGYIDDLNGWDFVGDFDVADDGDDDPFDDFGHGSHVAGTIAAVGDNGEGIVGVAYGARVMALKGFDAEGRGTFADLARAIVYASWMGADVINASWSCSTRCPSNPLIEETVALAHGLGVVLVFSAGNRADDVVFQSPEKLRETIVVAASTPDDERSGSSNRGFLVDVAAPGADSGLLPIPAAISNVLSLHSSGASPQFDLGIVADGYLRLSGTSMAAPHVSGLAALLLAAHPDWSNEDVRAALRLGADDLGRPGHDRDFGAGRVNAARSLALVPPDARGAITWPAPGEILSPQPGEIAIRGHVTGSEVAAYTLSAGRGADPDDWQTIATSAATVAADGVLGVWEVADLEIGGWVLRLEIEVSDGRRIEEFAPVSLERIAPRALSPPGAEALQPVVSGDLVVWSSARGAEPGEAAEDRNLFASDWHGGREHLLSDEPGDQDFPALSGRNLAWLGTRDGAPPALFRCRLPEMRGHRCRASMLAPPDESVSPPAVSGDRIVWSDDPGDGADVRLCELGREGSCTPRTIVSGPGPQYWPDVDGERVIWHQSDGGTHLFTCLLHPDTGACAGASLGIRPVQLAGSVSGDIVAWEELAPIARIRACRLDPATGRCASLVVEHPAAEAAPEVSDDRVVWTAGDEDGGRHVYFCEYDRVLETCPVQKLTGAAAGQARPSIDGPRVVWEDRREGVARILGVELPHLSALEDRVAVVGRTLVIPVRAHDPEGGPPSLRAELDGGEPVESLGADFQVRQGFGLLRWRPRPDQLGTAVIRFTATADSGLETSQSLRVVVVER